MESVYDGFVSRYLNRRVSRPIARLLSHTQITPNQVSAASLLIALGSFLSFAYGPSIAAALLAQTSSITDGVDGDLARIKRMTSAFGGFMDSIFDRYADALILTGLTVWTASTDDGIHVWLAGFWALAGTFGVTYTRSRIGRDHLPSFDRGVLSAASRDVRLLIVMIGTLLGEGLATLIALASLTNAVVLLRLLYARRALT